MTMVERSLVTLSGRLSILVRQRLWLQVLIGMAAGIGVGVAIGPTGGLLSPETALLAGNWIALPGKLFLIAIQFVVVPLVVASVIRGIAAGESGMNLRKVGGWAAGFFVLTTVAAVAIGLAIALIVQPGAYVDGGLLRDAAASATASPEAARMPRSDEIPDLILTLFPRDPLTTMVSGNMLQIVLTAAIIGAALVMTPATQRRPLLDLMASIQAACMVIVGWVLRFAPFAVFGLLAHLTARVGLSALIGAGVYVATVLAGLAMLLALYFLIAATLGGRGPRIFLAATKDALLLAFSTSSSAAVMPVSLTTAEHKLRVRSSIARFVIPLGATINMGGTALYQAVATIFLAQAFQVDIGLVGMALVVVMATGAAIGSPGAPGVGIVILATILDSVGVPATGIALIIGVDRLLDMCRTVANVAGDLTACVVLDRRLEISDDAHQAPADA